MQRRRRRGRCHLSSWPSLLLPFKVVAHSHLRPAEPPGPFRAEVHICSRKCQPFGAGDSRAGRRPLPQWTRERRKARRRRRPSVRQMLAAFIHRRDSRELPRRRRRWRHTPTAVHVRPSDWASRRPARPRRRHASGFATVTIMHTLANDDQSLVGRAARPLAHNRERRERQRRRPGGNNGSRTRLSAAAGGADGCQAASGSWP